MLRPMEVHNAVRLDGEAMREAEASVVIGACNEEVGNNNGVEGGLHNDWGDRGLVIWLSVDFEEGRNEAVLITGSSAGGGVLL